MKKELFRKFLLIFVIGLTVDQTEVEEAEKKLFHRKTRAHSTACQYQKVSWLNSRILRRCASRK